MSTNPNYRRYPSSWGPVVAVLLIIGGITLLILGSWKLSEGLKGLVFDYTNPYAQFGETTASQEIIDGVLGLIFGTLCLCTFVILFFARREFLFPSKEKIDVARRSNYFHRCKCRLVFV